METKKLSILLIEDDLAEARALKKMLPESPRQRFSVRHEQQLAQGLTRLTSERFDVALVALGRGAGQDELLAVRSACPSIAVIALITRDLEDTALGSLQMDIQDFLIKEELTTNLLVRAIHYAIERKRVTDELQENRESLRALVSVSAALLYRMSPDWQEMLELSSLESSSDTGESRASSTWFRDYVHPDDQPQVRVAIKEAIRTKSAYKLEHRVRRADGSQGWVFSRAIPLLDADGKIREWFGAISDITTRKEAEEAVKRSERKFAAFFHAASAYVTISTLKEGRLIDINDIALQTLGYERDEVIDRTVHHARIWKDEAARKKAVKMLEERGSARDVEVHMTRKNGQPFIGLMSAEIVTVEGEKYILSVAKDITERKQAEDEIKRLNADLALHTLELQETNRELEAFNYMVAHDLRNPLNTIGLGCQMIKMRCEKQLSPEGREDLETVLDTTRRMNGLITALLDFSRMAHAEPRRERLDLSSLAHEAAGEIEKSDPDRRVEFRIAEGITAQADASLIRVVLDNLIGNAWKYTGSQKKPVIEFGATTRDGEEVFFVRDNGLGFSKADLERIFVPFQRLPGAEMAKGFGIGLATVQRIIQRHGGRIWAEGEPGKGASFYFTVNPQE